MFFYQVHEYAADRILLYKQGGYGYEEAPGTAVFGLFIIVYTDFMAFTILSKLVELIIKMVPQIRLGCTGVYRASCKQLRWATFSNT